MCQDCNSASQDAPSMPEPSDHRYEKELAARSLGSHRLTETADKPLSSNESAMLELEQEIMELDEAFSVLQRRLQPVMNEESQKMAEAATDDRNVRMPVSELARSINEKASRVRSIRYRVTATIRSVDL